VKAHIIIGNAGNNHFIVIDEKGRRMCESHEFKWVESWCKWKTHKVPWFTVLSSEGSAPDGSYFSESFTWYHLNGTQMLVLATTLTRAGETTKRVKPARLIREKYEVVPEPQPAKAI
jgi:hypothetical protein